MPGDLLERQPQLTFETFDAFRNERLKGEWQATLQPGAAAC
jgi:hypothetical protein